jgi:hypothetical protein
VLLLLIGDDDDDGDATLPFILLRVYDEYAWDDCSVGRRLAIAATDDEDDGLAGRLYRPPTVDKDAADDVKGPALVKLERGLPLPYATIAALAIARSLDEIA